MVKFYGTSEPISHTIERLMKKENMDYILIDEPKEVLKAQKEYDYPSLPFAVIDGKEVYGASKILTMLVGEDE